MRKGKENNARGYDKIPESMGETFDGSDNEYLKDGNFMTWFTNTNIPANAAWIAYAGYLRGGENE